jgi:MFS family permease
LLSGFYLAAAVAQPLMGRFADLFGSRRIFCVGLALVAVTSVVAPLSPAFGWLIAFRVLQALGTSAAYPAGLAMIRSTDPGGKAPAGALGVLAIAASVSAALGPVIGGFLAALAGWPAIFLVNVPVTAVGLTLSLRWLPADARRTSAATGVSPSQGSALLAALRVVDLPGIALFIAMLASLLAFLLSLPDGPLWPLLPVAPIASILLVWRELRVAEPFLDVGMLAANRRLVGVYAQFAAVNAVFYSIFFSVPLWLERVRGFDPGTSGLLLLPASGIGVLSTPIAARLINRSGPRVPLIVGAAMLTVGSLLLLVFNPATPVAAILVVCAILGIPTGFNNLGLQAALYESAPAAQMGAAGGQFQTFRYVGAIFSTSLLGLVFSVAVSSDGLHSLAYVLATISAGVVAATLVARHR